jgi:rod shape determining protein RodA
MTIKDRVLRFIRRMNWPMIVVMAMALVLGVLFIYSSCYIREEQPVRSFYKRQIMWIALGAVCYGICAGYDFRRLVRSGGVLYAACIVLLLLVLVMGKRIYGARRWLMLVGGIGIQPSELAKLATLIFFARLLSLPEINLCKLKTFFTMLGVLALPVALILRQPDLGTAMAFIPPAFIMMYVAGVPLRYLLSVVMLGVLVAGLILGALVLTDNENLSEETRAKIQKAIPLSEYQQDRLKVLLWPDRDPLGAGWNKNQSEIAVGSGGMWGKGFLKGTQNILGFLPRSVAPTDFIYSVIAEEKGFMGSAFVLCLFGAVVVLGCRVALFTPDRMGRLLCVGIVAMVFCHVWINIAMTVGLMPITGLPLPLLSYGGSFLIMTMSSLGILQSVYARSPRRLLG